MKNSRQRRREIFFDNLEHRKENEKVRSRLIEEFSIPNPSRDDILKYKLWEECNKTCIYTGRTIPKTKLCTGVIQIDHILPYSRTLDDSYMNKTLCYANENRTRKGNRTPHEAYHQNPEDYEAIQQRARCLPYPKRRKFTLKQIDLDDFLQRQLNDTRYMSRLAVQYLRILGCDVRGVKGCTTAELRHQWGLNSILDSIASGQKTRDDHRHHAVDAAVIAMTTRSALQQLSSVKYSPEKPILPPPWKGFRQDVEKVVNGINISFRPMRKLAGKLHEDTAYGPGSKKGCVVLRKPVGELTFSVIKKEEIRDPVIRRIVQQSVEKACREKGTELKNSDMLSKVLGDTLLKMPSGVPIKKVRIERVEKTLVPIRTDETGKANKFVKPGGNHHIEIYEKPDGVWTGRTVSRFEAHQRLCNNQPVVCRNHEDGYKFIMSLCINDMVLINHPKTKKRGSYRVQKTSKGSHKIIFRLHTASTIDDKDREIDISSWKIMKGLDPKKANVNPLGKIYPCND